MDNLTGSMKDVAFATSPREFNLSYSTTLEEIMEKLNARRAAFQMPFQIKGGIVISFFSRIPSCLTLGCAL